MTEADSSPEKCRTIKVRPNPPIIRPPEAITAAKQAPLEELQRGADSAAGLAAIRKAEDAAMRPSPRLGETA